MSRNSTSNPSDSTPAVTLVALQHQSAYERPLTIDITPSSLQTSPETTNAVIWWITNIVFLDFGNKFLYRLNIYAMADDQREIDAWRTGQQEEWGRLGTTTSLMATISAASLAFSGIDQSWWLARAVFAGALGMSLCGFFVVHHLSVLAEGTRDRDVWRAANGELLHGSRKLVACVLAVPVVISAYSTLLILFGHIIFIATLASNNARIKMFSGPMNDPGFSRPMDDPGFAIVAGIPTLLGVVLAGGAVIMAEVMYRGVTAPRKEVFLPNQGTESVGQEKL